MSVYFEEDCSSTIFQFQSTDFHGHDTFAVESHATKRPYHEVKISFAYINFWDMDEVNPDTVKAYFSQSKLGWMAGHHDDLTQCIGKIESERPPLSPKVDIESPCF